MERIFLFIKHNLSLLWGIIDRCNSYIFKVLFKSKMETALKSVMASKDEDAFQYRKLGYDDLGDLYNLIHSQPAQDLKYFSPHGFEDKDLKSHLKKPSFLMMGAFDGDRMIGYFFLRFFLNRKCFVGRLIDRQFRGRGAGEEMNRIMYETAWNMGFRCLSTISRNNTAVMRAHAKNPTMKILKGLKNDYLLVEFIKT